MPKRYGRKRYGRRKRYRKTPWYSKKMSAMQLALLAWKGVKRIKGLVNSEMFKSDVSVSAGTISSTGNVSHLTGIAQGDGDGARTGNSILLKRIFGRINVTAHASAYATKVRLIIFTDTQTVSDTAPAVTDVLESASYLAPLNNETVGRFTINWQREFIVEGNANAVARTFKVFIPYQQHVRFNGTAATDQQKGAVYILLISSEATNVPSVDYRLRVSYHDN